MEDIKNRIISISGEPASGKSSVVKLITEKYKSMGYSVHIISVGTLFREMQLREYNRMFPEKTDVSISDIQADPEFRSKLLEIDKLIDKEIENKGREINSIKRPNSVYIIDSRLAWRNIPSSYAVRLTVSDRIAGKRVFYDNSREKEDKYNTLDEAISSTKLRKQLEIKRYLQKYNVDITDSNNYDLIIDTSYSNVNELANVIINGENHWHTGNSYPKTWATPVSFLPLQLGRTTGQPSCLGNTIESLAEDIKREGYNPSLGTLEIVERNGIKYLLEGNHRTFAALSAGMTLLPYKVTHTDDKIANNVASPLLTQNKRYLEYLYDYVDGIQYYGGTLGNNKQFSDFSIKDLSYYGPAMSAIDSNER